MSVNLHDNESLVIEVTANIWPAGNWDPIPGQLTVTDQRFRFEPGPLGGNHAPFEVPLSDVIELEFGDHPGGELQHRISILTCKSQRFRLHGTWEENDWRLLIESFEKGLGSGIPLVADQALSARQLPAPNCDWDGMRTFAYSYDIRRGRCGYRICLMNDIAATSNSIAELRSALWQFVVDVDHRIATGRDRPDYIESARAAVAKMRQLLGTGE